MAKGVAASDRADLISRAVMTLKDGRHDPRFGNAKTLFARARAIMVVPQPIKGGVFVGGVGANGILTTHHASAWSKLSFYALGAVSCGMRIGVEVAEVAMVVMNNRAFNAWMTDKVTLGAQAGITLEGSIIKPRTEWNTAYTSALYDRPIFDGSNGAGINVQFRAPPSPNLARHTNARK